MRIIVVLVFAALLMGPVPLFAQRTLAADTPLSEVIPTLYALEIDTNIQLGAPVAAALSDLQEALILTGAISDQLATFPLGSSAGGFAWTFHPETGTSTRHTSSFGPLFAERALTVGRGRLNVGLNYQHTSYNSFDGRDLKDHEIVFYTAFSPGVIGEDALSVKVSTDTIGLFANYGLTDRLDVGVAAPIVRAELDATIRFLFRNSSGARSGTFEQTISGGGSATGLGDIVVRGKYKALDLAGGGIAAAVDLRLPTGNEEDLLGIPGTQVKIYGILSSTTGILSPHANIGYTFSRGNDAARDPTSVFIEPSDEFGYAFGADFAVMPRLTLAGDFVGRALRDVPRLTFGEVGLGSVFQEFSGGEAGTLNTALFSVGAKYNVWSNLLVTANVLVPITDGGLRSKLTPVIGFDYSF